MVKYRKYITWSLIFVIVILFWLSLRSETLQLEFSIAALVVWGITFFLDKQLKNAEEQEK